jgi:hypothetical protein
LLGIVQYRLRWLLSLGTKSGHYRAPSDPARRAMNVEAAGDEEMTFRGANRGLIRLGDMT